MALGDKARINHRDSRRVVPVLAFSVLVRHEKRVGLVSKKAKLGRLEEKKQRSLLKGERSKKVPVED